MATVTGQSLINQAITDLGILEQGSGNVGASDSASALVELNSMWDAWSIDEGMIYSVQVITKALTTATASYTIGTGGVFNVTRPTRVYTAFFTLGGQRNSIKIVDAATYYEHNDLAASAVAPDEVYLDWNVDPTSGLGKVYLWPVPTFGSGSPALELEVGVPFTVWALTGNVILPYGYQDLIAKALAWRLIPAYGDIIPLQKQQQIAMEGEKAEMRIRTMNTKNRMLPPGAAELMPPPTAAPAAQR